MQLEQLLNIAAASVYLLPVELAMNFCKLTMRKTLINLYLKTFFKCLHKCPYQYVNAGYIYTSTVYRRNINPTKTKSQGQ